MEIDLKQEKELVEQARNDPESFGVLYDRYYNQILNYVLKRTASITSAQDITSDVFFKALKNIGQFRWQGVPFSAWLYRIASNEIANSYRKSKLQQKHREYTSNPDSLSNPSSRAEYLDAEAELQRNEEFLTLHQCIAKLPVKYQEVITLRYFEEKQLKEISQILDKREGTVKSLLHRGLEKLRTLVE